MRRETTYRWTRRVQSRLETRGSPRLQMAVILAAAGAAAFLTSFVLLRLDVRSMAWRYPLAGCAGYLIFLLLLGLWLIAARRRDRPDVNSLDVLDNVDGAEWSFANKGRAPSADALELEDTSSGLDASALDVDVDEGALILIPVAILVASAGAAFYVIYIAPALFAELLLEGLLLAGVYRRLKRIEPRAWYSVVLRRTWIPFACLTLALAILGYVAQSLVPEARSIGELFRER
jgi:hypothetical protein